MKKDKLNKFIFIAALTALMLCPTNFTGSVKAETFQGWQVLDFGSSHYDKVNDTIRIWSDRPDEGLSFSRDISPETDFTFSLQVKASDLIGFGIAVGTKRFVNHQFTDDNPNRQGVYFEFHNKYGANWFLLARYVNTVVWETGKYSDVWTWDGFAVGKEDVWYTMELSVHAHPFRVSGEVIDENGTSLGCYSVSDMVNLSFEDIQEIGFGNWWGGDYSVRNISDLSKLSQLKPVSPFSYSPSESKVNSPVVFDASQSFPNAQIVNYTWNFGDGNTTVTQQPSISHTYQNSGSFNVTLTVVDAYGLNSSLSQVIQVRLPTYIDISTDTASSVVGSSVNINGKLTDYKGDGLANSSIVVSYSFTGANLWYPVSSAFTDENGKYYIQWANPASGTFTLKAQYAGDSDYLAASSITTLSSVPYQNQNAFFVESNSTVTSLGFNSTSNELAFSVSGPSGTTGYVRVTIAKGLVSNAADLKVTLDGKQLSYNLTETEDAWVLLFSYSHSQHFVSVYLPAAPNPTSSPIPTTTNPPDSPVPTPALTDTPNPSVVNDEPGEINLWLLLGIIVVVVAAAAALGLALRRDTKP